MSRAENLGILNEVATARGASAEMLTMLQHIMGAESGGKRYAANDRSSARGCFQFIDGTWLGMLKTHGAKFGHGEFASAIRWTGKEWTIDDPALKAQALNLRYDVKLSCEMGLQLAYDNQCILERALGRKPTAGELYLAHFLGSGDALQVLKHPDANAKIKTFLSEGVMRSNSDDPITGKTGVSLRKGGKRIPFMDFTVADIQQWAANKMDQELSYEQLSEQNRQASWRRRHPRQLAPGQKDDYSDMTESQGDLTMSAVLQFIGMCIVGAVTAIGGICSSILGLSNDTPGMPASTPSRALASTPSPVRT